MDTVTESDMAVAMAVSDNKRMRANVDRINEYFNDINKQHSTMNINLHSIPHYDVKKYSMHTNLLLKSTAQMHGSHAKYKQNVNN